jgi:hypothetical protein
MILYTQTLNEYESERSIVIIISIMKDELIALSEMRSNIHVHGSFTLRKDDCPLSSLGEGICCCFHFQETGPPSRPEEPRYLFCIRRKCNGKETYALKL